LHEACPASAWECAPARSAFTARWPALLFNLQGCNFRREPVAGRIGSGVALGGLRGDAHRCTPFKVGRGTLTLNRHNVILDLRRIHMFPTCVAWNPGAGSGSRALQRHDRGNYCGLMRTMFWCHAGQGGLKTGMDLRWIGPQRAVPPRTSLVIPGRSYPPSFSDCSRRMLFSRSAEARRPSRSPGSSSSSITRSTPFLPTMQGVPR